MTPALSLILCIVGALAALWFLFVIVVVLVGAYTVIHEHVGMVKRRKALRKRLASQGAPFNRLERRTGITYRLA